MVEVSEERLSEVTEAYLAAGIKTIDIGKVTDDGQVLHAFFFFQFMAYCCSEVFNQKRHMMYQVSGVIGVEEERGGGGEGQPYSYARVMS